MPVREMAMRQCGREHRNPDASASGFARKESEPGHMATKIGGVCFVENS
jgi:hypothetical protein